jgi:hypothetical protein
MLAGSTGAGLAASGVHGRIQQDTTLVIGQHDGAPALGFGHPARQRMEAAQLGGRQFVGERQALQHAEGGAQLRVDGGGHRARHRQRVLARIALALGAEPRQHDARHDGQGQQPARGQQEQPEAQRSSRAAGPHFCRIT